MFCHETKIEILVNISFAVTDSYFVYNVVVVEDTTLRVLVSSLTMYCKYPFIFIVVVVEEDNVVVVGYVFDVSSFQGSADDSTNLLVFINYHYEIPVEKPLLHGVSRLSDFNILFYLYIQRRFNCSYRNVESSSCINLRYDESVINYDKKLQNMK